MYILEQFLTDAAIPDKVQLQASVAALAPGFGARLRTLVATFWKNDDEPGAALGPDVVPPIL